MPSPATLFQIICLIPIIGGGTYSVLSVWTILRFFAGVTSTSQVSSEFKPAVTVLKPVRGLEKDLKSGLRSICVQDFPNYQVIYSVQDPDDPALPILQEIQQEFGSERVSIVISTVQAGANGKINNLLGAIAQAQHDIIIMSDSDTHLRPDYIESMVAPLADPSVGCVCSLFKVTRADRWFEKIELLMINADFMPSVIFADVTGAAKACLGPSIAIARSTLEELGGLESLAEYKVEDYELGRRVWTSGKKMMVLPYVIDVVVDFENWHQCWNHQVYWDQNTYLAKPGPFIATVLIRAVPFALLFAIARLGDDWGLAVLGGTLVLRWVTAVITSKALQDEEGLRNLYLLPLRDTLGLIFWALAFTKRTVVWRDREFQLTSHGKIVPRRS